MAIPELKDTRERLTDCIYFGDALSASVGTGFVPTNRTIATTLPLTGGGDLSANRTFAINSFAGAAIGAVPVSVGGTVNFLRADGVWATPPGGVPATRTINTTAPLAGGGPLSGDLTLSVGEFDASNDGTVPASGGGVTNFLRADGSWVPAGVPAVPATEITYGDGTGIQSDPLFTYQEATDKLWILKTGTAETSDYKGVTLDPAVTASLSEINAASKTTGGGGSTISHGLQLSATGASGTGYFKVQSGASGAGVTLSAGVVGGETILSAISGTASDSTVLGYPSTGPTITLAKSGPLAAYIPRAIIGSAYLAFDTAAAAVGKYLRCTAMGPPTNGIADWAALSVTDLVGTLPVVSGGTGATSMTAGFVPYGAGTSPYLVSPIATNGVDVAVGTALTSGIRLSLGGTLSSAMTQTGLYSAPEITATLSGSSILATGTVAASTGLLSATSVFAGNWSKGSGATITDFSGFLCPDMTAGTKNYGINLGVTSGTNKWNVFAGGSAQNYFAGKVGVKVTTPTADLEIAGLTQTTTFKMTTGAAAGYVLTSDAAGLGSWSAATTGMTYKGAWDASTNTPTLADGVGTTGDTYAVSVGGTQFGRTFVAGGWCIYSGTIWQPVGTSAAVTSVNGLTGVVVLDLASSDFANQGTTTTVLHGNAAGNPSFGQIVDGDITTSTIGYDKLAAMTSANLASKVSDETGSGALVFATSPTLVTPTLGAATATSLGLTNALTVSNGGTGATTLTGIVRGNGTAAFTAGAVVALASDVSGTLPITNGGTGNTAITAGYIPYGAGTSPLGHTNNLFWDSGNNRLGVLMGGAPQRTLDVNGIARAAIEDKGGQVHNVKAYGAAGDGTTDDTTAIGLAITAAAATTPRGVVFFPPGKYKTSGNFDLGGLDGLRILGSGVKSTTFLLSHATNDLFYTNAQTYSLQIGGFRADTFGGVTRTGGWVFDAMVGGLLRESIVEDIHIFNQNNGIKIAAYEFVEVMRCYMRQGTGTAEGATAGIGFQAGPGSNGGELHFYFCEVDGNNVAANRTGVNMAPAYGFYIDNVAGVRMISCHGTQVKTTAIELVATSSASAFPRLSGITLTNCIADNTYNGPSCAITGIGQADHVQFSNCWFAGAGNYGVSTTHEGFQLACASATEISLVGCTFYAAHGNGIGLSPSTNHAQVIIGNCSFRDNGAAVVAGNRNAIYYNVPATNLGPCVTGCTEYGHQYSIACPAATTVRALVVGNAWTSATSLGTAPTVNANNGPV